MSLSDSFDIKEKYDEYKIEVDIETAQREFLPIDIQFNTVKTKYKIFSIVEPLKFNVVTRKLLGNSGEIITNNNWNWYSYKWNILWFKWY